MNLQVSKADRVHLPNPVLSGFPLRVVDRSSRGMTIENVQRTGRDSALKELVII